MLPTTIRQATEEGYPLSALEAKALAVIEEIANRPGVFLDMNFCVGDIQFLSNRTILHARTAAMSFHERVDQAGGGVKPEALRRNPGQERS